MSAKDHLALVGTTLGERFQLVRVVAEGGFGVVYEGRQVGLGRTVAVKVLKVPEEYSSKAREAFIDGFVREARTIARLCHPAIVTVHDSGVSLLPDGEPVFWMALEWLPGRTLADDLKAHVHEPPWPPARCLELLRPAFEALAYAHEEGVAHRDVKPSNMVVVPSRNGPTLRLLDFGIAKDMENDEAASSGQTRTTSGFLAFSPRYAAPEQIGRTRTGPWTDVHALALIVTETLTRRSAYTGDSLTTQFAEALSAVRPTPARFDLDVGAWEPVLAKALALNPAERFRTAGEFLTALEASLPGARATTRSVSNPDALQPPPRRPGAGVILAAAALLCLSSASLFWALRNARTRPDTAPSASLQLTAPSRSQAPPRPMSPVTLTPSAPTTKPPGSAHPSAMAVAPPAQPARALEAHRADVSPARSDRESSPRRAPPRRNALPIVIR